MQWISVDERLPDAWDVGEPHGYRGAIRSAHCIVFSSVGWSIAALVNGAWVNGETEALERGVTHWMPLPDPPTAGRRE